MTSLREKTISGLFWSFIQKAGVSAISFLTTILLARILSPKDFGLIGMLTIFIQLSQSLIEAGFNSALIQKKDPDAEDYSSVFYINLVTSIFLYIVLFFCAPFISNFYQQPILTPLTRVLSLVFVINSFAYVQEARLNKELQFKVLMIIHLPSIFIGGLVSISMALLGFGVWSIVAMQVATRFAYTLQIWIRAKWKPLRSFNKKKAKDLFSFGGKLMLSGIFTTLYNNIYLVVIGKFYPISSVGYYQNGYTMATTPSNTITSTLNSVTFPAFSSIQDDDRRLKGGYRRVMQQAFFWICPLYILVGVLAYPLFDLIFTSKWLPAVPYFRWLCVVGVLQPLLTYNLNIVNVKGRSDIWLKLQLVRRIVTIIAVFIVIPFGITALLIVQAASSVFSFILFSYYSGRFIQYSVNEQLRDLSGILFLSVLTGCVVFLFDHLFKGSGDFARLLLGMIIGVVFYWFLSKVLNITAYLDFSLILREKLLSRVKFLNR